jgi:putative thiazole-containing bacteriocin maturation protein
MVSTSNIIPIKVDDFENRINQESDRQEPDSSLFEFFSRAASDETGIFHIWDEQDLKQLPLSQCMIQAVNPLSEGPAELLPKVVCAGLTHIEGKREAGLVGIEMYISKFIESSFLRAEDKSFPSLLGIGTGETIAEGICRGLQNFLEKKLKKRAAGQMYRVKLGPINDPQCQFYLQSLTVLNGVPAISLQEDLFGFPIVQVHSNHRRYAKPGLNLTLALRNALKEALMETQNETDSKKRQAIGPAVLLKRDNEPEIPSCEKITPLELVKTSEMVIKQHKKQLVIYDLTFDPFIKEQMSGVYGVWLQEEET